MIRKAKISDIDSVAEIYDQIHKAQEDGLIFVGWIRDLYPTRQTAIDSFQRGDLFVYEKNGKILSAAIINQIQDPSYYKATWNHQAEDKEVCVLHTLVVHPQESGKGLGKEFVKFYENYAKEKGLYELRMDTNEKNQRARTMYKNLGYKEIAMIPTVFNKIEGVNLVLLEKNLLA